MTLFAQQVMIDLSLVGPVFLAVVPLNYHHMLNCDSAVIV
jgi:hypothetical protein